MTGSGAIIWRKAAVIGSIWAASEIVLGSFLHNVRAPFTGEMLTAIGIAVLVAGHRLWPERGLLWRAGLVCALMKSISPSAVIFGPMIAIAMEGALAELGVRLLRGPAGYLLGGGLAMSWALAQKTLNLLILYGPDMIDVYLRGAGWLLPRLGLGSGGVWAPLQAAFAVYFLAGAAAAAAGMCVKPEAGAGYEARPNQVPGAVPADAPRPHSWTLLFFHVIFSVFVLGAGRRIPLALTAAGACLYALFCARRYPRVRLMFGHAGLWAGVFLAALSAGLVLGSIEAGAYMAFRAVLLTVAFAALGGELKGRAVRTFVERIGGGALFETLEYAFGALPGMIAGLPSGREFARDPLGVIGGMVARAPFLLDLPARPPVHIISGSSGAGKSVAVMELARALRVSGGKAGGICAVGLWEGGERAGFDLVDLASGRRLPLCRRGLKPAAASAGEFGFYASGLEAGAAALSTEGLEGADVVFVDEVGPLELSGGGWAAALDRLVRERPGRPLVLTVRESLVEAVRERWGLRGAAVWEAGDPAAAASLESALRAGRASEP